MCQLRNNTGFTLLEVLVSLIILGISFGVLFETLSQSKRVSWKADETVQAARVAHNLLASPKFVRAALDSRGAEGTIKDEKDWHYSFEVSSLKLQDQNEQIVEIPGMLEIKLCISRAGHREQERFCLTRWYRE